MRSMHALLAVLSIIIPVRSEELPFILLEDTQGRLIEAQITGPAVSKRGFPGVRRDGTQITIPLEMLNADSIDRIATEMRRQQSGLPAGTKIAVQSLTIKQVGGKFRYFFQISNMTSEPFAGSIEITMQNAMRGITNGGATAFSADPAIPAGGSTTVYIDRHTGPRSVHADASIVGFHFEVKAGGKSIASGSGSVAEDFVE